MTNTEHNQRRVKMLTAEELKKFERNLMTIKGKRLEWYLEVQPFNTFSDFIKSSFSWAHSPEHHTYWSELSDRLEPAPYSDWLTPRLREDFDAGNNDAIIMAKYFGLIELANEMRKDKEIKTVK